MLDSFEHRHYKHYWVTWDPSTVANVPTNGQVSIVTYKSRKYFDLLARAEYLINNSSFPKYFDKRADQIYIYTSHGVPLKKMGSDIPGQNSKPIRDLFVADKLISASPYMTASMYQHALVANKHDPLRVLETGLPRVDVQFTSNSAHIRRKLIDAGISLGQGKLILYAPTWRAGSDTSVSVRSAEKQLRAIRTLADTVRDENCSVLIKLHPGINLNSVDTIDVAKYMVPNDLDANSLLSIVDILVTDYSSIFFDFLCLNRPIAFFLDDVDSYAAQRGLYLEPERLPGPIAHTREELISEVKRLMNEPDSWASVRRQWHKTYTPHDDGVASARVIRSIFPESLQ